MKKNLFFQLIIMIAALVSASAQSPEKPSEKILFQHENWIGYQQASGILVMAKGKPVRIQSLNGVDNALVSKALQQISFGAFYQKGKKTHYFIRFSPSFITGGYLEDKTQAKWRELGFASFRNRPFSLLNYFEKLQNQLTLWQIEPVYSEKDLPPGLAKALQEAQSEEEQTAIFASYFWQNLYVDWKLRKNSVWFENLHIQVDEGSDPIPLQMDFLAWINGGILFNKKQSEQDGGMLENLYMTTTLSTLEQQPSFSLDFGFKHLPTVLEQLEEYRHLYR